MGKDPIDAERAVADLALSVAAARRSLRAEELDRAREQRAAAEELLRGRDSPRARKLRTDLATASATLNRLEVRPDRRAKTCPPAQASPPRCGIGQFFDDDDESVGGSTLSLGAPTAPSPDLAPLSSLTTPRAVWVPALRVGVADDCEPQQPQQQQQLLLQRKASDADTLCEYKQLQREALDLCHLTRELAEHVEAQSEPLTRAEANVEAARDQQLAGIHELHEAATHRVHGVRRVCGVTGAAVGVTAAKVASLTLATSLTAGLAVGAVGGVAVGQALRRSFRSRTTHSLTRENVDADVAMAAFPRNTAHMIAA